MKLNIDDWSILCSLVKHIQTLYHICMLQIKINVMELDTYICSLQDAVEYQMQHSKSQLTNLCNILSCVGNPGQNLVKYKPRVLPQKMGHFLKSVKVMFL